MEQEVGGSSPPNCTNEINDLREVPRTDRSGWLPSSNHTRAKHCCCQVRRRNLPTHHPRFAVPLGRRPKSSEAAIAGWHDGG